MNPPTPPSWLCRDMLAVDLPAIPGLERTLFAEPGSIPMSGSPVHGDHFLQVLPPEVDLQRLDLGRLRLRDALDPARKLGCGSTYLEVRESNRASRALVESMRFKTVGKRKQYYNMQTEDAILYRWDA